MSAKSQLGAMVLDTAHLIYTIRREYGLICTQTSIRTYNLGTTSDEKLGESLSRSNAIFHSCKIMLISLPRRTADLAQLLV
jgi:hypothetical protein